MTFNDTGNLVMWWRVLRSAHLAKYPTMQYFLVQYLSEKAKSNWVVKCIGECEMGRPYHTSRMKANRVSARNAHIPKNTH